MALYSGYTHRFTVEQFLLQHHMHPDYTHVTEIVAKFRNHIIRGLTGDVQSSLLMLPTYVHQPRNVIYNQPVLVMDAGGTNLRKAVVSFLETGQVKIENFTQVEMPGSNNQSISFQAFYDQLASLIDQEVMHYDLLSFCFSYPIESTPERDGKVLFFSKEIGASEVIGSYVGQNLKKAVHNRHINSKLSQVIVLNDTVTTLLSGIVHSTQRNYSAYIGFILGTGINMAYVASYRQITKLPSFSSDESQIINLEAGGFNALHRGSIDIILDQQTTSPGSFAMEKMISGAYFGRLCAITLEQACQEELFDRKTIERLRPILDELDTKIICQFYNNINDNQNILGFALQYVDASDRESIAALIALLLQRTAKIVAASLSAVVLESLEGFLPTHPVCITIDGTTFYSFNGLQDEVKRLMREEILVGSYLRYFEFNKVENASLVGAAMAAYAR